MHEKSKIGAGHAGGMFRKGMTELGQYLPAFNSAGTHTVEDQGVWPNRTQAEIGNKRGMKDFDATLEAEKTLAVQAEVARLQADQPERTPSRSRGR